MSIDQGSIDNIPSKLYKYRPINEFTCRLLAHGELKFSSVDEFNDPFEGKAISKLDVLTPEGRNYSHKIMKELGKLSPAKRLMNIQKLKNKGGVSYLTFPERELKEIGIYSMSEVENDPLMWAHYADSHKGICIAFDTLSDYFKAFVHPIQYTDVYPVIDRTVGGT